ncbi:MAG: transposase [Pseudoruegeria sp.]
MSKRRKRRSWSDDEKREICQQTLPPGASVAQVARRYAMNANMIHNWLKDPRFAPPLVAPEDTVEDAPFIEVAMHSSDLPLAVDVANPPLAAVLSASRVDITLSDGRRILVEGPTELSSVVGLVQGLMA